MRTHVVAEGLQDSGKCHPREWAAQLRTDKHCIDVGGVSELVANVIKEFAVSFEAFPMEAKLTGDLVGGLAGQDAGFHDIPRHRIGVAPELEREEQFGAPAEEPLVGV